MRLGAFGRVGGALAAGALASSAWGAGGCAANKQTELVPGVMSQIQVPRNLQAVRVDVQAEGVKGASCFIQNVDPKTGGVTLPRTLGVVPGGDEGRVVTVTVTGYSLPEGAQNVPSLGDCLASPFQDPMSAAAVKILRRSRQRYVGGKILFLPMPLKYSCWEAAQCKDDETCVAGACVPADIDSTTLREFRDDLIDGASNTCFSAKQCLADAVVPAKVVDAATCTYAYPLPSAPLGSGLNVRVYYDRGESEILDYDDPSTPENMREGFTIPDPSKQELKLAKALCDMVNGTSTSPRRIIEVRMGTPCVPKTVIQPICNEDLADPHSLPDGGTTTDGGCNIANDLQPAPSALYVLLDDAKSMTPIYGPIGLSQVLGFSLSDPVFRTTSLAFKLLPHAASDCTVVPPGPTTYSMPDVPFDLASKVQAPIAAIVGNTSRTLSTDPPLLVDAALQPNGAYKALVDFRTAKAAAFNRMAVMLVVNRTITDDCGAGHAMAVAEAAAAFNAASAADRVYTYVVMLGSSGSAQDATTAQAIASAGGPPGSKQFFDARADGLQGPLAFTTIVSDLGSCLYEKPANIDTGAIVSYTDPLSLQTTNVAFNGSCKEATQNTADGWNVDAGRVRICGKACTDLRTVLVTATSVAEKSMLPAPNIPVTATQPCK